MTDNSIKEKLRQLSADRIKNAPDKFYRFLLDEIDWDQRLIGISGARGTGKTTLLLQHLKSLNQDPETFLYVSLDDIFFTNNNLLEFAGQFFLEGGKYLFLDEVHKYPGWSHDLKQIYDNFPQLKIVFTSSSALEIYKGSHDLSRRLALYHLPGLSLREYLDFSYGVKIRKYTLKEILSDVSQITSQFPGDIRPVKMLTEYLRTGYYPFFLEGRTMYHDKLRQTINTVLETDLPAIFNIDFQSVLKLKKLLAIISSIVPFRPNISKLSEQSGVTRDTLLRHLNYLDKANVIRLLTRDPSGTGYLVKPEKLYLENTNLMYALAADVPNTGSLRETFFLNQVSVKHKVNYPVNGDFMVDNKYTFEIGGKGKTMKQIAGIKNAFLVQDNIESGFKNNIPLWLFGFLY
jgi:predicted AAA+ superfamily ATPase